MCRIGGRHRSVGASLRGATLEIPPLWTWMSNRAPLSGAGTILPHVLDGLMEAPWATARYVPVEGGTPGTPESEVASAGTYELQAIGCASGTRLLN